MKGRVSGSLCTAGVLSLGMAAFAQTSGQPQSQAQTQPGARSSMEQEITVTGCVQKEADYRRAHEAGGAGVAGTGVGAGNEFILTDVSTSGTTPKAGEEPTGTAGASRTLAYELTGPKEGDVGQFVGRRVEIKGKLKAAEKGAGGQPTGGATAGTPPRGTDVMSKDLKLRELEVSSVRETSGTCPPVK